MITLSKTIPSTLLSVALGFTASAAEPIEVAPGVLRVGTIAGSDISESSGLVASKRFSGTYWTHNDRGNSPKLFAISRAGETLGEFRVTGANLKDWEDIELDGGGNLYIADIGNNDENREELAVYKVREPNPRRPATAAIIQKSWKLRFPNDPFDCEAFFVSGRFGYLISKEVKDDGAAIYRFPLVSRSGQTITLQKVGDLAVTAPVTGADLSRDARRLGVITGSGAYVFSARRKVLTAEQTTVSFTPFENSGMEGGCFAGDGFLVSSESGELYLFNQIPFRAR